MDGQCWPVMSDGGSLLTPCLRSGYYNRFVAREARAQGDQYIRLPSQFASLSLDLILDLNPDLSTSTPSPTQPLTRNEVPFPSILPSSRFASL